jgi:hypothetical protein
VHAFSIVSAVVKGPRHNILLRKSPSAFPQSQAFHLTVRAFSIVSAVVKVLDTTTAMVVAGSRPFKARATSTGSTLARNRSVRPLDSLAEFCAMKYNDEIGAL